MHAKYFRPLGAGLFTTALAIAPASADDFYRGKTINIVVGLSSGGGYDLFARTIARRLGAHTPGEPRVIVTNMPGAGSLTSVLWVASGAAPRDGTTIVTFNHGLVGDSVMTPERIRVDFRKFAWIGSAAEDLSACYMWHKSGLKTIADIKAHGAINFGQTAAGSSSDTLQHILRNIVGLTINTANGDPGSAEVRLAVERGELDGDCGAWAVNPPDWVENRKIFPFIKNAPAQTSDMPPGVPYAVDAAPTERGKAIVRQLIASTQIGRPFVTSPETPPERLAILRKAFDETMGDPAFIDDLKKQNLPWSPRDADAALAVIKGIVDAPPDIVEAARKTMNE